MGDEDEMEGDSPPRTSKAAPASAAAAAAYEKWKNPSASESALRKADEEERLKVMYAHKGPVGTVDEKVDRLLSWAPSDNRRRPGMSDADYIKWLTARTRVFKRNEGETDAAYAARLAAWQDTVSGSTAALSEANMGASAKIREDMHFVEQLRVCLGLRAQYLKLREAQRTVNGMRDKLHILNQILGPLQFLFTISNIVTNPMTALKDVAKGALQDDPAKQGVVINAVRGLAVAFGAEKSSEEEEIDAYLAQIAEGIQHIMEAWKGFVEANDITEQRIKDVEYTEDGHKIGPPNKLLSGNFLPPDAVARGKTMAKQFDFEQRMGYGGGADDSLLHQWQDC